MSVNVVRVGFFGKLPSRGDFVRAVLSRTLTEAWIQWLQPLLPVARSRLGEDDWNDIWHATRPWRFALAPGLCCAHAVGGVWLTSADKVGRHFPLMIAAETEALSDACLDTAEDLGRQAIKNHTSPAALTHRLSLLACSDSVAPPTSPPMARWWRPRDGRNESFSSDRMPDAGTFVGMLTP